VLTLARTSNSKPEIRLLYRRLSTLWIVLAFVNLPMLEAQQEAPASEAGPKLSVTPPAQLNGSSPLLVPTSAAPRKNELLGGLGVGAVYDDSIAIINGRPEGGFLYTVSPNITLLQTRPRTAWDLDYVGGITVAQHATAINNGTQDMTSVAAQLQHLFGPHTLLMLRQDFLMTNNPFGVANQGQTLGVVGGTGQLNSSAAIPTATRTSLVSSASLTYQFARHASVGINGSFSSLKFGDVPKLAGAAVNLIDGRTTTGRAFYVVDISQHHRLGAEYQLQDLRFQDDAARTLDQTVYLFDEIRLRSNMILTFFAGPDCSHLHNNVLVPSSGRAPSLVPLLTNAWSPAGGAAYTWRGNRHALRLSASRAVTDGGGTTGAVRATTASAELHNDLSKRWTATFGFSYSDGRLLEGITTAGSSRIATEQVDSGITHQLSQRIRMSAQYTHVQQLAGGTVAPLTTGDHNRASLSLMYQFAKPLGQ